MTKTNSTQGLGHLLVLQNTALRLGIELNGATWDDRLGVSVAVYGPISGQHLADETFGPHVEPETFGDVNRPQQVWKGDVDGVEVRIYARVA